MLHVTTTLRAVRTVLLVVLGAAGCAERPRERAAAADEVLDRDPPAIYRPGRWRLAMWDQRHRTVLFVSHIVIRHRESDPSRVQPLRPPGWEPDPPAPDRSPAQALRLARDVAAIATEYPGTFAQLAARYSDDVVTRARGGSLGGVRASQLPDVYLDAIATLTPGEVSDVFETAFGFHVLLLRAPPAQAQVGGRRIAIRYRGTVGGRAGSESGRGRDAAKALAEQVATQARAGVSFDALCRAYSEHVDAQQGCDLGVYSVLDPDELPRQIERLSELELGEVSEPIEGVFGFEVLQRTPAAERSRYAMEALEIKFDPTLPQAAEESRRGARELARSLARRAAEDPSAFAALRNEHCCNGVEQWSRGRGPVEVSQVVERLAIGETAREPIESGWFFYVPRRVDPPAPTPPQLTYELPAPRAPDFVAMVEQSDGVSLADGTRVLLAGALGALQLPEAAQAELRRALEQLATTFARNPDPLPEQIAARVAGMHATMAGLNRTLGAPAFQQFQQFMSAWGEQTILGRGQR